MRKDEKISLLLPSFMDELRIDHWTVRRCGMGLGMISCLGTKSEV